MSQNFTIPYTFTPATAASPQYIKSAEVNKNFNCMTQLVCDTVSGHIHDGYDSKLVNVKCGIARVVDASGMTNITFAVPFIEGMSFSVVASGLTMTSPATNAFPSITTQPWTWNRAGFSLSAMTSAGAPYDGSSSQLLVNWISYSYTP